MIQDSQRMILIDALEAHGYDEWYSALLTNAIEQMQDAAKAVHVANAAFARMPKDASKPMNDDANALGIGMSLDKKPEEETDTSLLYGEPERAIGDYAPEPATTKLEKRRYAISSRKNKRKRGKKK